MSPKEYGVLSGGIRHRKVNQQTLLQCLRCVRRAQALGIRVKNKVTALTPALPALCAHPAHAHSGVLSTWGRSPLVPCPPLAGFSQRYNLIDFPGTAEPPFRSLLRPASTVLQEPKPTWSQSPGETYTKMLTVLICGALAGGGVSVGLWPRVATSHQARTRKGRISHGLGACSPSSSARGLLLCWCFRLEKETKTDRRRDRGLPRRGHLSAPPRVS